MMKPRVTSTAYCAAWSLACLLVVAAGDAAAQAGIEWCERDQGRFFEGIVRQHDVSGDVFRLIGVELAVGRSIAGDADAVSLWAPAEAVIDDVRVHEPRNNYRMVPRRWNPGQTFLWPTSQVIRRARIDLQALRGLAKDVNGVYSPVVIGTDTAAPDRIEGYEFYFYSRGEFSADWSVRREDGGVLVPEYAGKSSSSQPGLVRIGWNGRSEAGQVVPSGIRRLVIRGKMTIGGPRSLSLEIPFRVYGTP